LSPQVYLIAVKLVDVFARSTFVLAVTYSLKLSGAGQFGIIVTLVGLFAFAFNFERHIDIQRRTAGESAGIFDRAVLSALKFYAFNYALMMPLFVLAVVAWAHVSWTLIALCIVVVVAEQLSNQTYQFSLITPRYYPLLGVVAAKNTLLVAAVLFRLVIAKRLDLGYVLEVWAIGAVACTVVNGLVWLRLRLVGPSHAPFSFRSDILSQHRASFTHFVLGLIAVLVLQNDRLVVGALLHLDQVGVYFRHTLLISFAYQAFNIASFNRILPVIFTEAKMRPVRELEGRVLREYGKAVLAVILLTIAIWAGDWLTGGVYAERYKLQPFLLTVMLIGFLIRAAADLHALILNAKMLERSILRQQMISFAIGITLLIGLTWKFGIIGSAVANLCGSSLYLVLIRRAVRGLPQ